ncbi:leucyl aminopeptidase [Sphingomonas sp. Y38-1Y]|uniref:leucyl aminopeptidase n=1 Tax=Sphingomonas sp. Y38-1Y TaxID=3078265 RepID=UPI0028E1C24B|nr:leucyl aminopeptidase [Sphingomonas sp. Y38-1Y]
MKIEFQSDLPDLQDIAIAVPKGAVPGLDRLDAAARTLVEGAVKAAKFEGEAGSVAEIFVPKGDGVGRVILIGTGSGAGADLEKAGGALAGRYETAGIEAIGVDLSAAGVDAAGAARFAGAAAQRAWRFDIYRTTLTEKQKPTIQRLVIAGADDVEDAWREADALTQGLELTRTLVAEPPNILYPETFVERCRHLEELGVTLTILDEAAMGELGMGALLGVSQGSAREARLLAMHWNGTGTDGDPTIALVGKGVTFDTGGISLKPGPGMEDMKWDMGGAGAVAGAMKALAMRKAKANVIGVVGLVENMPDGNAQRPGDVVKSMSGQTIEILNTDAEGRLVLCDVLTWVQRNHRPKTIVDLATLTGAMIIALGNEHGGLFSNDDALADALLSAGRETGDKLWRFPLSPAYDKLIDSPIADVKNVGPRGAGSITAAQFLQRFVETGTAWAHLDIAGMVWADKPSATYDKGATGYGVRLLDRLVRDLAEG